MRRAILTIVASVIGMMAFAQDIHINFGERVRVFAEQTTFTDNSTTFGYIEYEEGTATPYVQLFREWKKWQAPLFLHYEVRTSFVENSSSLFLGGTYSMGGDKGFFSVSALGRYDVGNAFAPQASESWSIGTGRVSFSGYADQWWCGELIVYAEGRLYVNVSDAVSVGTIVDVFRAFGEWGCVPRFTLRYQIGK